MEPHRFPVEPLLAFAGAAFSSLGVPPSHAALWADTLVRSDLRGHPSHGIFRLPWYIRRLQRGVMQPVTRLETIRDVAAVSVLDAQEGVGQVAANQAMELAIERANAFGIAAVAVRRSNHFGAAMYFTLQAAHAGLIGMITTNASPAMAPWGGKQAVLGNNPWSIATPAGRHAPLILDIANTMVARGKIYTARQDGRSIPNSWAIDRHGNPTTDPTEALAGLILPIGGHKGYAVTFMMDVLSGVLSGAEFASGVAGPYQAERRSGCGHLIIVLNIEAFIGLAEFNARVEQLIDEVKSAQLAPGFDEIFYPGEPEARAEAANARDGIILPSATVAELTALADELALPHPFHE
ncbi:MAG TPA: Ldh family oxidoreductase [Nitrolancea sp.]|jgi:LDH2 family malate/lactate/ureidoglycolate dehydrogenase|nr:Ldh family oxidoreductase [Nitrolancea sp.]